MIEVSTPTISNRLGAPAGANWHVLAKVTTEDGVTGFGYIVSLNAMFMNAAAAAYVPFAS